MKNDEDEEFRRAVDDVKPIPNKTATFEPVRFTPPPPVAPASGESPVEFGEELRYLRPGIQAKILQKLRRGNFPIEEMLDLHGLTAEEANHQLRNFLQHSQAAGMSVVRIIHGKGYGSAGRQPVLKTKVNQWLQDAGIVLAFCSARPENGGTGAVDILLRKNKRKP